MSEVQSVSPPEDLHSLRNIDEHGAQQLRPGEGHYTAYVGPPTEYDTMGAMQFRLLTTLGLRHHHRLLDYGCGSLRAGRLFIPYLDPDCYYGLEPNRWLIDDALERQIGRDIVQVKRPTFLHHNTFGTREFGVTFDFILAQSIFSHTGPDLTSMVLHEIRETLAPNGLALVTFVDARWPKKTGRASGWVYPSFIRYTAADVRELARQAGLSAARLRWHHPRQRWYALARTSQELPPLRARRDPARTWQRKPEPLSISVRRRLDRTWGERLPDGFLGFVRSRLRSGLTQ